jgi:hypothetical protein
LSVIITRGAEPCPFRSLRINRLAALALDQSVEGEAMLIDGVFLPANGDDDLVELPFVTEPAGRLPPNIIGELPADFLRPQPHGLVRDNDILDHAQAERKPEIEPIRHGQSVTLENGGDDREDHVQIWSCRQIPHFPRSSVNVTVPLWR